LQDNGHGSERDYLTTVFVNGTLFASGGMARCNNPAAPQYGEITMKNAKRSKQILSGLAIIASLSLQGIPTVSAAEPVSVRLNWVAGAEHGFFYLAKEKGWYEAEGIDLEIIGGSGSTMSVSTVGNGDTNFALADGATVARAWEVDAPIVATGVLLRESPASVYSFAEKGITKMSDLCGKRVGLNLKSTTTAQFHAMVSEAKLGDGCKIEEVPMSGGGSREVLTGVVDAAVTFSHEDPVQLRVQYDREINEILASEFFQLFSLAIITNKNMVRDKRDIVDKFTRVTRRAIEYAANNPEEAVAAFMRASESANVDYERAKLNRFITFLSSANGDAALGSHTRAEWEASVSKMREIGLVKAEIDMSGKYVLVE
jgi:NitT/TauT family transport system substrate-binding protein